MKTVGNFRKTRFSGFGANQIATYMIAAAYNLLRVARLARDAGVSGGGGDLVMVDVEGPNEPGTPKKP